MMHHEPYRALTLSCMIIEDITHFGRFEVPYHVLRMHWNMCRGWSVGVSSGSGQRVGFLESKGVIDN